MTYRLTGPKGTFTPEWLKRYEQDKRAGQALTETDRNRKIAVRSDEKIIVALVPAAFEAGH